ncbi:MAG: DUF4129 domain-containing protein [Myxococcales bacterium]|nr:DUF4129 domain-containing protein [Myxococcales bacterium]
MPFLILSFLLAWPGPAERSEGIERTRAARDWETELNVAPAEAGDEDAETGTQEQRPTRRPRPASPPPPASSAGSGLASVLLWVVIGLCAAAVLVIVLRDLTTRPARARAGPEGPVVTEAPTVEVRAVTLDEAEALAREGRWAEAIHVLLLRTFADLGRQASLAPALTSREILALVPLQPEAEAALRHLVTAVEVSLFGAEEPSAEDYGRCRDSFRRLLGARGVSVG